MGNKRRKLNLWQNLTNDYTALAQRAEHEYAERTAANLFIREIEDYLKIIRTALEAGDLQEMEAAHNEAFDTFGHIIHPELFAEPTEDEDDGRPKDYSLPSVAVWLPAKLAAIYSNWAVISHSQSEVVIDFARLLPGLSTVQVDARIVLTPTNAKLLLETLRKNLALYEDRFGAIRLANDEDHADNPFAGEAPDWLAEDDDLPM